MNAHNRAERISACGRTGGLVYEAGMPGNRPTLANIRKILAPYIPEAETREHARRLREAGLLPGGGPGRDGVASAELTPRQTALLLIALACGGPTTGVAAEA